jgi:nitrogen fixation NifU-like protein
MEIWLKFKHRVLVDVTFLTDGCGTSIACGSMATELAKGKTIAEALAISPKVILENLGGLPDESAHCADLASSTLKKAVMEHIAYQKEPWKRAYRSN